MIRFSAVATYLVGLAVLFGLGFILFDVLDLDGTIVVPFFGLTFIGWTYIGLFASGKVYDSAKEKTEAKLSEIRSEANIRALASEASREYASAKNRFEFLSGETLMIEYEESDTPAKMDFRRLALEEELVRRGLISHSPMHERMNTLGKHFGV